MRFSKKLACCRFGDMAQLLIIGWMVVVLPLSGKAVPLPASDMDELLDLSLDELMNLEVDTATSLVKTSRRTAPSTVTKIDQDQIRSSGARSIIELLDIYVPNFKWTLHTTDFSNMGLRGIIGWENKFLILVNGRVMNIKTSSGAVTERDLPMLSDIAHIEVIRGPGSALHGPGAVSMVISIVTEDSRSFNGQELSLRLGAIERFQSLEYKYGQTYKHGGGLYLYGGYSHYDGASVTKSPNVLCRTRTISGTSYGPDDRIEVDAEPFNASYQGLPIWKGHAQYNHGGLNIWYRATHGGSQQQTPIHQSYYREAGYWQHTFLSEYEHALSEAWAWKTTLSYDWTNLEERQSKNIGNHSDWHSEDEVLVKTVVSYNPQTWQSAALGLSWSHDRYGLAHNGKAWTFSTQMPRWHSDLYSLFGEYNLRVLSWMHFLTGGRLDRQTHSEDMFSPRAALVLLPSDKDTVKVIVTRSMRTNWPESMRGDSVKRNKDADPEILRAYELRYERLLNQNTSAASSLFYHDHDLIGYSGALGRWDVLGNIKSYGVEAELSYRMPKRSRFDLSYAFTKMTEVDINPGANAGKITYADRGYGNDFALWGQHILKAVWHWAVTSRTSVDTSVIAEWGQIGSKDNENWEVRTWAVRISEGSRYEASSRNINVNIGWEHRFTENLRLRGDAYNLLYWLDDTYNKRKVGGGNYPARYRVLPPGLSLSLYWKFK